MVIRIADEYTIRTSTTTILLYYYY